MEAIGVIIAIILLLWACSGGGKKNQERYRIEATGDPRYCEVIDNQTGTIAFVGSKRACELWLQEHEG